MIELELSLQAIERPCFPEEAERGRKVGAEGSPGGVYADQAKEYTWFLPGFFEQLIECLLNVFGIPLVHNAELGVGGCNQVVNFTWFKFF